MATLIARLDPNMPRARDRILWLKSSGGVRTPSLGFSTTLSTVPTRRSGAVFTILPPTQMPRSVVATPAPTWDPSKFAAGHSLDSRRAAVHQLAEKLAAHPGSATFRVIPMPEQSLAVRLLAELAEAADAAHDSTTVCCVLSCVANLRLVGLPAVDIARMCSLVMQHASAEPETRAFACAAAYNLSQEPWVLETLSRVHVDAGEPLSARPGDPPEVA